MCVSVALSILDTVKYSVSLFESNKCSHGNSMNKTVVSNK